VKVVTVEEMRAIERAADAQGLSYHTMMDNAGRAVATWLTERGVAGRHIVVLVGPGNNGGDGLVAARHLLQAGADVSIYCWKRDVEGDENWHQAVEAGIPIVRSEEDKSLNRLRRLIDASDLIVDALLGTGVSRPITGSLQRLLAVIDQRLATRRAKGQARAFTCPTVPSAADTVVAPTLVALDVPGGLDCNTGEVDPAALAADTTVTLAFPKVGQFLFPGAGHVGELIVADIGIDEKLAEGISLEVSTPELVRDWLPERPLDGHKGSFGKAMIVAGSVNYTGAACLAASAALRAGAGLVTLGIAEMLHPILASKVTEATYLLLPHEMGALVPEASKALLDALGGYDALLLGPGLGRDQKTVEFVGLLLDLFPAQKKPRMGFVRAGVGEASAGSTLPPLVIDADGLNALSEIEGWETRLQSAAVLTPHPGEMARLVHSSVAEVQADRIGTCRRAAKEWNVVVVLKGAHTVISSPEGVTYINPFASPALATGGTGDVLAGVIVSLIAQGQPPLQAAVTGAYLHGLAGQMVGAELGRAGTVAGDLLTRIPLSIRSLTRR
jgi:NAD(P)H-hydrate epimerase